MVKPKVRTKKFLDWVELRPFLEKKGIKLDKVLGLISEYGDFHNGCDVPLERPSPSMYEPPVQKLAELLFEEFPDAVDGDDTITLHIWW